MSSENKPMNKYLNQKLDCIFMFFMTTDDVKIFYEKNGKGKPILFLHGLGTNSTTFKDAISVLKKSYTTYAMDLRGHGRSENGQITIERIVQDIDNLLVKEKIKKCTIVGHSLGSFIALKYAETRSHRVKKLILLNEIHEFDLHHLKKSFILFEYPYLMLLGKIADVFHKHRYVDFSKLKNSSIQHIALEIVQSTNPKIFTAYERLMKSHKIDYKKITIPVLIVQSTKDEIVPYWCFNELAKYLKDSTVIKTDSDHCLPYVQPGTVSSLIKQFA